FFGHHFFLQAEDGIRGRNVTGVETCALPIFSSMDWSLVKTPENSKFSDALFSNSTSIAYHLDNPCIISFKGLSLKLKIPSFHKTSFKEVSVLTVNAVSSTPKTAC